MVLIRAIVCRCFRNSLGASSRSVTTRLISAGTGADGFNAYATTPPASLHGRDTHGSGASPGPETGGLVCRELETSPISPRAPTYRGEMIEAGGGVVVRTARRARTEVLLIHRPHRDDWTLPKGKRQPGETVVECALREVREETGLWCDAGDELPATEYLSRKGRPKIVRYWAMQALGGEFTPNREVDEIRWLRLDRVGALLTHARDLVVVEGLRDVQRSCA